MKKIIFQINVPDHFSLNKLTAYSYMQDMYEISERNAKLYAKKFNAEYYKVTTHDDFKLSAHKHLDYQKLKMYDFIDYDQILYVDSDFIIKENAPSIFDICGYNFGAVTDYGKTVPSLAADLGMPANRYFNAGFMCIPKNVLEKTVNHLPNYLEKDYRFDGQGLLNKLFYDLNIERLELSADWNPVKKTFGLYADHYAGQKKKKWGSVKY